MWYEIQPLSITVHINDLKRGDSNYPSYAQSYTNNLHSIFSHFYNDKMFQLKTVEQAWHAWFNPTLLLQ